MDNVYGAANDFNSPHFSLLYGWRRRETAGETEARFVLNRILESTNCVAGRNLMTQNKVNSPSESHVLRVFKIVELRCHGYSCFTIYCRVSGPYTYLILLNISSDASTHLLRSLLQGWMWMLQRQKTNWSHDHIFQKSPSPLDIASSLAI